MPEHAEPEHDQNDVVLHHVHEAAELGESLASGAGELAPDSMLPPGLGLMSKLPGTAVSLFELIKDPTIGRGLDVAAGVTGVAEDVATLAGSEMAEKFGPVGSAISGAKTLNELRNGDFAGATRDGVGTVMQLAGPEGAAMAAAWNVGWTAGEHLDHWANGEAAERNYLGGHRTVDEHSMDVGDTVNNWVGHGKVGKVAGAFAAAGTGLVDTGYTGLRYGADEAGDGARWAGRQAGNAVSAVENLLRGGQGPSIPEIVEGELHARTMLDDARTRYADAPEVLETQLLAMKMMGYGSLVHDPLQQLAATHAPAPATSPQAAPDQSFHQLFQHYAD